MRKKSARFGKTNGRFFFALCVCVSFFGSPIPTKYTTNHKRGLRFHYFCGDLFWSPKREREEEEEDAYLVAVEMKTSVEAHT